MSDERKVEVRLADFQRKVEQMRQLFDQYFAGVIKQQPSKDYAELQKYFRSFKSADFKTTASRFLFQTLQQRYIQYKSHWDKTLKQIEDGTFRRDLNYLKKVKSVLEAEPPATASPVPPVSSSPDKKTPTVSASKISPALHKLYDKVASLSQGKGSKAPDKERFLNSVAKQVAAHKEKNPGKKIEIKVTKDKDGKIAVKIQSQ